MPDIGKLISGFRVFKSTTYLEQQDIIRHLSAQGQKPSTLVVSCVDLKIAPAILFATIPGELYIINNLGGLVPQYSTTGVHGIASAIEYAVNGFEVENIIVLGHARCNSIKMMMSDEFVTNTDQLSESMKKWLSIASKAREAVKKEMADKSIEDQQSACEHESIIISLRNLMSYPYIAKRMEENTLNIFGWHFDIETGNIMAFDPDTAMFEPIS